jgi:hypothetical protein
MFKQSHNRAAKIYANESDLDIIPPSEAVIGINNSAQQLYRLEARV